MSSIFVKKIWVDKGRLYAESDQGQTAYYELSIFKGFRHATDAQIHNFEVIDRTRIHWPDLDEDINLEGMFYDNNLCSLTSDENSVVYHSPTEVKECVAEPETKYGSKPF